MRNEGDRLLESVDEAVTIGRESGCPVHISHHKAGGRENWGRVADSLAEVDRVNAASAAGPAGAAWPPVTLDFYPYTASSGPMFEYTSPETITPDWAEHNQFATCPPFPQYQGRRVAEVAAAEGLSLSELVRRVFATADGRQTISIGFGMSPDDLATNVRHPLMMIGSDGIPDLNGLPHPRLFGTFPRIYAEYVRRLGLLTMAEAVRRMTSLAADRFGLADRGRLEPGAAGDLVVFDPAVISDVASYTDPQREPVGMAWVVVNGELTYDHGRHVGARAGQVLNFRTR